MSENFDFIEGNSPMLVSFPHNGTAIPDEFASDMTTHGRSSVDTDWFVRELYPFLGDLSVSTLTAHWSRYVVDLNRPATGEALYPGQLDTGLCPVQTFAGDDLYIRNQPDEEETHRRIKKYWQPYHLCLQQELERLRAKFGYALLWDAHSIRGYVSQLFAGRLPDLNLGTYDQTSATPELGLRLLNCVEAHSNYSVVLNGRFKGGYITRHYGDPEAGIQAVQLEINQQTYLINETILPPVIDSNKLAQLSRTLQALIAQALDYGKWQATQ